jgi:hypothetical protein
VSLGSDLAVALANLASSSHFNLNLIIDFSGSLL